MESYRVSSHYTMEYPRKEYLKCMGEAQRNIDIVCGEFDSIVYNTHRFIEKVRKLLESDGKITVIFNGNSKTMNEAVGKIKSWNHNFMCMVSELEPSNRENVRFYWCPIRPKSHYAIIDDSTLVAEEEHGVGKPRDIYCFKEDPITAEDWENGFDKMKEFCKSIPIDMLVQNVRMESTNSRLQRLEGIAEED